MPHRRSKRPFGIKTETDVLHDIMFQERIKKDPSASRAVDRLLATLEARKRRGWTQFPKKGPLPILGKK
jgi:hypothetical protein